MKVGTKFMTFESYPYLRYHFYASHAMMILSTISLKWRVDRKKRSKCTYVCSSSIHLMKEICEYRFVNVQHVSSTCTLVLHSLHNDIYVKFVDGGDVNAWQTWKKRTNVTFTWSSLLFTIFMIIYTEATFTITKKKVNDVFTCMKSTLQIFFCISLEL